MLAPPRYRGAPGERSRDGYGDSIDVEAHGSTGRAVGRDSSARVPFTLLRRAGCALCDDFERTLRELDDDRRIGLQRVDIDEHPAWRAAYHEAVPVLLHAEREVCRHFPDWKAVCQVLSEYNARLGIDSDA